MARGPPSPGLHHQRYRYESLISSLQHINSSAFLASPSPFSCSVRTKAPSSDTSRLHHPPNGCTMFITTPAYFGPNSFTTGSKNFTEKFQSLTVPYSTILVVWRSSLFPLSIRSTSCLTLSSYSSTAFSLCSFSFNNFSQLLTCTKLPFELVIS